MSQVQIDSLVLQVPGLSAGDGQRLALEVTRGLREKGSDLAGCEIPALRLDISAGANTPVAELAGWIVAGIVREIQRLP
jgi:hypothetical protein